MRTKQTARKSTPLCYPRHSLSNSYFNGGGASTESSDDDEPKIENQVGSSKYADDDYGEYDEDEDDEENNRRRYDDDDENDDDEQVRPTLTAPETAAKDKSLPFVRVLQQSLLDPGSSHLTAGGASAFDLAPTPGLCVDGKLISIPIQISKPPKSTKVEFKNANWDAGVVNLAHHAISLMTGCSRHQIQNWGVQVSICRVLFQDAAKGNEDNNYAVFSSECNARLVIQLPSIVQGGALNVLDRGISEFVRYDFGERDGSGAYGYHFACFFSDECEGFMEQVQSGHRVLLVYDLKWDKKKGVAAACGSDVLNLFDIAVENVLSWVKDYSYSLIPLSKFYNLKAGGVSVLEGEDKRLVDNIEKRLNPYLDGLNKIVVYLVQAVRTKKEKQRYYYHPGWGMRECEEGDEEEDDEDDYDMNEMDSSFVKLMERDFEIDVQWMTQEGKEFIFSKNFHNFAYSSMRFDDWIQDHTTTSKGKWQYLALFPQSKEISFFSHCMGVPERTRFLKTQIKDSAKSSCLEKWMNKRVVRKEHERSIDCDEATMILKLFSVPNNPFTTEQLKQFYTKLADLDIQNFYRSQDKELVSRMLTAFFNRFEKEGDFLGLFQKICRVMNANYEKGKLEDGLITHFLDAVIQNCPKPHLSAMIKTYLEDVERIRRKDRAQWLHDGEISKILLKVSSMFPEDPSFSGQLLQSISGCCTIIKSSLHAFQANKGSNEEMHRAVVACEAVNKVAELDVPSLNSLVQLAYLCAVVGSKVLSLAQAEPLFKCVHGMLSTYTAGISADTLRKMLEIIRKHYGSNLEVKIRLLTALLQPGYHGGGILEDANLLEELAMTVDNDCWKRVQADVMRLCDGLTFGKLMSLSEALRLNNVQEAATAVYNLAFSDDQRIQMALIPHFNLDDVLDVLVGNRDFTNLRKLLRQCNSSWVDFVVTYLFNRSVAKRGVLFQAFGLDVNDPQYTMPPEVPTLPNSRPSYVCVDSPQLLSFMHSHEGRGSVNGFTSVVEARKFIKHHTIDGVVMEALGTGPRAYVSVTKQPYNYQLRTQAANREVLVANLRARLSGIVMNWARGGFNEVDSVSKRPRMV